MFKINGFFTSGWFFDESECELKNRYQMINIGILLSASGLVYGIIGNYIRGTDGFIPLELALLCTNIMMFFALRMYRNFFEFFAITMTLQYTFLFLFLIYVGEPSDLKHLWIFTYPIILLYFQKTIHALYWLGFMLVMLIIAPLQGFVSTNYSMYQVTYLSFVLAVVSIIIYFYKKKIDEAKNTILEQQNMLKNFNSELERQVKDKTTELIKLNESLGIKVEQKLEELRKKDQILELQSKQAVMGEMISMIAHQWRQPLSNITLQIANLQLKHMLDKERRCRDVDDALTNISNTIIYLSDTIDDFQTYFCPNKKMDTIEIHELFQRAVNFSQSRVQDNDIKISINKEIKISITVYINELIQVILNILNNAIDAHNEVKPKNPSIIMDATDDDENISLLITDNAGGIDDEHMSHLFEPYYSTKGKNGTGLGLYMSKMIVEKQFNGEIDVQTSSVGSTFIIKIPKNIK
ncbi:histidine kinase [Sulfurimonas denitrificans DSM 1251]|uniref:histidine kinase n=1 Tax=Sulfurimonas denitrificans (strain ATCC 33889 / DSM 1251) TaxID=326298 RepID=Q30TD7_SULDN|nr:sensor histidine kinase [Sulfurimonas denitrificans]ABB43744.1 histidine kinase [Sulfurimonas denitrificans DSM 1251]